MKFTGYASTTETPYDMGWYTESIKRGAFGKTLAENPDVVLNIQHGAGASGLPIARTTAGTLALEEDNTGLRVDADLDPDDPDVALVARKMARGHLDGQMSFAFEAVRQQWNSDYTTRTIIEANIHRGDVSIVTQGANPTTSSSLREAGRLSRSASVADRRRMAAAVSVGLIVVETRSFTLDGVRYSFRDSSDPCNRCGGDGTVDLGSGPITCPQCKGSGTGENNVDLDDGEEQLSALARVVEDGRAIMTSSRLRLETKRYSPAPLPSVKTEPRKSFSAGTLRGH